MICKNLKKRSKKLYYYFYCAKKKEKVSKEDCFNCREKEYKKVKKMKYRSSKRSIACNISKAVRKKVLVRDKGFCVVCERPGVPNSHYIKRSHGGLGIEQNVVCMCLECHNAYDNGKDKEKVEMIHDKVKSHLKRKYGTSWKEENLYYKKGE